MGKYYYARHFPWIVNIIFIPLTFFDLNYLNFLFFWGLSELSNQFTKRTLRKILGENHYLGKRPLQCHDFAVQGTYGMPSDHAQLSTFFAIYWGSTPFLFCLLSLNSIYISWTRVKQKYHTKLQVIVGTIFGVLFSYFFHDKLDRPTVQLLTLQ